MYTLQIKGRTEWEWNNYLRGEEMCEYGPREKKDLSVWDAFHWEQGIFIC